MRIAAIVVAFSLLTLAAAPVWALSVSRIATSAEVVAREPVDPTTIFTADVGTVYCFTQLTDIGESTTIHHLWSHEGTTMADVELTIEGTSWRTWSSKKIMPYLKGKWTVTVTDAQGVEISTVDFSVE